MNLREINAKISREFVRVLWYKIQQLKIVNKIFKV